MLATVPLDRLYLLFAVALDYPGPALAEDARACRGLLAQFNSEAAGRMEEFGAFLSQTHLGQVQEVYTNAFDLQPVCYPYVGYQLFGESYKRGAFLVKLQEEYRARGFSAGKELPDHLPVMLRFLSVLAARGDTELEENSSPVPGSCPGDSRRLQGQGEPIRSGCPRPARHAEKGVSPGRREHRCCSGGSRRVHGSLLSA